jgi:hypothetical protein
MTAEDKNAMPAGRGWTDPPPAQQRGRFWGTGFWVEGQDTSMNVSTSVAAAIVSVTKKISQAELDALTVRLRKLDMPTLKAFADGALGWDIPAGSEITQQVVRAMAVGAYDARVRGEARKHQFVLEVVKIVVAAAVGFLLGKYT